MRETGMDRIICNVEPELDSFHDKAAFQAFALGLSCERATVPVDMDTDKAEFLRLLNSIRTHKFALYKRQNYTDLTLERVGNEFYPPEKNFDQSVDYTLLLGWLDDRKSKDAADWWLSNKDNGTTVTQQSLTASDLLHSVQGWPAPLPHDFGLCRRIFVKKDQIVDGVEYVLLPNDAETGEEPPATISISGQIPQDELTDPKIREFSYDINIIDAGVVTPVEIRYRTNLLEIIELSDSIVNTTGFLGADEVALPKKKLLSKISNNAHSLMWNLPYLLNDAVDERFSNLAQAIETARDKAEADGASAADAKKFIDAKVEFNKALSELGMMGALAILDPLIIALTTPGCALTQLPTEVKTLEEARSLIKNSAAEGQVLTLLIDSITENLGTEIAEEQLVLALKASMLNNPLLSLSLVDNSAKAELQRVLGLDGADDDTAGLLTSLLSAKGLDDYDNLSENFDADLYSALAIELLEVSQNLSEESGAEKAMIRFLEKIWLDPAAVQSVSIESALNTMIENMGVAPESIDASSMWGAFKSTLLGSFNGAEAARQSNGMVFKGALLADLARNASPSFSMDEAKISLRDHSFFDLRWDHETQFTNGLVSRFDAIGWALPRLGEGSDFVIATRKSITEVYRKRELPEFLCFLDAKTKFVAELEPQALPIAIAQLGSVEEYELFNNYFNGVNVLIRKGQTGNWTCANINSVVTRGDATLGRQIIPISPTVEDGFSSHFIDYEGVPLRNSLMESISEEFGDYSYYKIQDADFATDGLLADAPPALVYGASYDVSAFVSSNYSSLPIGLQGSDPWQFKLQTPPSATAVSNYPYSRRTALGRLTLTEVVQGNNEKRVGATYPAIRAFAKDYPRQFVTHYQHLDLFRGADGIGQIHENEDFEYHLAGGLHSTLTGQIEISIFAQANALHSESLATFLIRNGDTIEFSVTRKQKKLIFEILVDEVSEHKEVLPSNISHDRSLWLRLGKTEGWSSFLQQQESGSLPPVLLLGDSEKPDKKGKQPFKKSFTKPVHQRIGLPRMSFHDFDRWITNSELRKRAGFLDQVGTENAWSDDDWQSCWDSLWNLLWGSHVLRSSSPAIGELLDALPDLAVQALLVEMCVYDSTQSASAGKVVDDLVVTIPSFGQRVKKVWGYDTPHGDISTLIEAEPPVISDFIEELKKLFFYDYYIPLIIKPGATDLLLLSKHGDIELTLQQGHVAELSISPLVSDELFAVRDADTAPYIDPQMLQLAIGKHGNNHVFAGEKTIVESIVRGLSMPGAADINRTVFDNAIDVNSDTRNRAYTLAISNASDASDLQWRTQWGRFDRVAVKSQRWRFSGVPISNWYNPGGSNATTPANEVIEHNPKFEAELFYNRDHSDEATEEVLLGPLKITDAHDKAQQDIYTFTWPQPSATYLRHRFRARSRYEGAHKNPSDAVLDSWNEPEPWTKRVVMLADLKALTQLTTPQVRLFQPLTSAIDASVDGNTTPPIMAVSQEPPYAVGGLAERVTAEIKTGYGYGFEQIGAGNVVQPMDSRKEFGPDPRLTSIATLKKNSFGMALKVDGPVGHSFDEKNLPDRKYVNSSSVLTLTNASLPKSSEENYEEHFSQIALRRYLDPSWAFVDSPSADQLKTLRFTETGSTVVGPVKKQTLTIEYKRQTIDAANKNIKIDLAKVSVEQGNVIVKINCQLIDPYADEKFLQVCSFKDDDKSQLVFMHKPESSNSGTLLIFIDNGESQILLASVIWTLTTLEKVEEKDELIEHIPQILFLSEASQFVWTPTSVSRSSNFEWARTNRNFDLFDSITAKSDAGPERLAVSYDQLLIRVNEAELNFYRKGQDQDQPQWIQPKNNFTDYTGPVSEHKFLGLLLTRRSPAQNSRVYMYDSLVRLESLDAMLNKQAEENSQAHLIEYSVPARPLIFSALGARAEFDLLSIQKAKTDGGAWLVSVRVKSLITMPERLEIHLKGEGDAGKTSKTEIDLDEWTKENGDEFYVHLSISSSSVQGTLVDGTGNQPAQIQPSSDNATLSAKSKLTVVLKIAGDSDPAADVSIRYFPDESLKNLPFELFFGETLDLQADDIAAEVSAQSLHELREAQARVIAISPAIKIME
jgi:hypothetical protein